MTTLGIMPNEFVQKLAVRFSKPMKSKSLLLTSVITPTQVLALSNSVDHVLSPYTKSPTLGREISDESCFEVTLNVTSTLFAIKISLLMAGAFTFNMPDCASKGEGGVTV